MKSARPRSNTVHSAAIPRSLPDVDARVARSERRHVIMIHVTLTRVTRVLYVFDPNEIQLYGFTATACELYEYVL